MPVGSNSIRSQGGLSLIVLAGGKSQRMGSDKAFLIYRGKSFVQLIVEEMMKISNDTIVVIGQKGEDNFRDVLDRSVRILKDELELGNPIGGMITGFSHAKYRYAAVLACDSPLVKHAVIKYLCDSAQEHSASVPIWENNDTEPLCAVYDLEQALIAVTKVLRLGKMGPKNLLAQLADVNYVPVSRIREYDPLLESLVNINSREDYIRLLSGITNPIAK
ncbi:MAG: molybdenum cofactor guanylyltransferase [Thaumarchaeota archaeon]|nr:molybdenum cofactor guanylyltransferase [Nitrososphaerota archaeon]